jgi:hypothetical protein
VHSITVDTRGAEALLTQVGDRLPKALARALNRGISAARTVMVREVARDIGLKSSDVRQTMRLFQATPSRLEAKLDSPKRRISLLKFNAKGPVPSRGNGRGVTYRIGQGGRKRIPDAFIATMPNGAEGVFVRAGKARLPIKHLYGPSLGIVFAKHRDKGLARGQEQFQTTLAQELRYRAGLS